MPRIAAATTVLLLALGSPIPALAQQGSQGDDSSSPEALAQSAAEAWLDLIWSGQIQESWEEASEMFKQQVTAERWAAASGSVVAQTGEFRSRTLESAERSSSLPNVPPGDYMTLRYSAVFEAGPARELVTMVQEDGTWRSIGYLVTPP